MGSYLGDKRRAKRRKGKGKFNEYIDGNIGWVVIWVTKKSKKGEKEKENTMNTLTET